MKNEMVLHQTVFGMQKLHIPIKMTTIAGLNFTWGSMENFKSSGLKLQSQLQPKIEGLGFEFFSTKMSTLLPLLLINVPTRVLYYTELQIRLYVLGKLLTFFSNNWVMNC